MKRHVQGKRERGKQEKKTDEVEKQSAVRGNGGLITVTHKKSSNISDMLSRKNTLTPYLLYQEHDWRLP